MAQGIDAINGLLERTKRIDTLLSDGTLMRDAVVMYERDIAAENAATMFKGERSDGSRIEPPYSPKTIAIKRAKRHPYDRVTLRDTGSFQGNLYLEYNEEGFEITSSDWKANPNSTSPGGGIPLQAKYGDLIFGLQQRSIDAFAPMVAAALLAFMRKILEQ